MTTKITTDNIASETLTTILGPKVSSIVYPGDDTAANTAGGDSITLLGSGFNNGASVVVNGTSSGVVTVVSSTQITFTAPAQSAGTYVIYVINSDGGTAISIPGISYSGTPTWSTTAGNIGVGYETGSISTTVTASGDAPITYSVVSGTLPTGSSLNTSSGLISGTASATASSTTYSFTISANDAQNQTTNRAFSITVNPDVVTWSTPTSNETYSVSKDIAIANVAMSATSASGGSITYTADTLPTGLSITGANIAGTPTVAASTSTTLTATSTSTRTATRTINWVVSIANDTYFKNVTLLLNGETTVTPFISDASTNSFGLTIVGDTKPVLFNPYQEGYYSNYFDGTGDYLTTPSSANFTFPADFTIECWIYVPSISNTIQRIFSSNAGPGGACYFSVGNDIGTGAGAGKLCANGHLVSPYTAGFITASTAIPINTWIHVALVRNGSTITIYQNGVSVASATDSATWDFNNSAGVRISGAIWAGSSEDFGGYMSNLRIVKGTAVYTSAFTPSTTPLTAIANTSLLICQSNRLIDNSTNAFSITKNGDVTVSPAMPFTANSSYSTYGSTYFDGTGDYLTVPDNSTWAFSGDFTIESWIYPTTLAAETAIFTVWYGGSVSLTAINFNVQSTGRLRGEFTVGSSAITTTTGTTTSVTINQWNHVAVSRSGTTIRLFVNGVQDSTTGTLSGTINNLTDQPVIGAINSGGAYLSRMNGYISDVRVITGTAVYTANFTPPTTPLTAITNTQLLTCQYNGGATNQAIIDNSNFNNIITRFGNTSQGTFSPYSVSGWSNYFDGTGDYLTTPSNATLAFGSGDFCLEFWIYTTTFGSTDSRPLGNNTSWAANAWSLHSDHGTANEKYTFWVNNYNSGSAMLTSTSSVILNTWTHVAITRSGTSWRMFINGVQEGSTVTSSAALDGGSSDDMYIGGSGAANEYVTGYMSNVRVVKGTAVYTTTFTPSTTPLTAISGTSLLTCQSNRLIDNSPNSSTLTRNGDVSVQAFGPFGSIPEAVPISYSNYFDGSGDYLRVPYNAGFAMSSSNFTIEYWVYPTVLSGDITVLGAHTNDGNGGYGVGFDGTTPRTWITFGSGWLQVTGPSALLNAWNHIALVRNGSSFYMYTNGVPGTVYTNAAPVVNASNSDVTIGARYDGTGNFYTGYVSNARIVKGTAVYTTTFTPSTTPLTAIANTSLLTCQSTTMIDNSTNAFAITAVGNTVPRIFNPFGYTAQSATSYTPSIHGGSAYFDGTGDYLSIPTNTAFAFGTGDFTIEAWVLPNALASDWFLISSSGSGGFFFGFASTSTVGFGWGRTGVAWDYRVAGNATVGVWQHVAVTRSGTSMRLFVNGTQSGTTQTLATDYSLSVTSITIGSQGANYYLNGYISDLRIVKGTAVYTSNFVPPAQTLTNYSTTYPASLLLNFNNGGIIDQHGTNVLETVGNAQLSTAVKKYNNGSIYFDGTGDYLASLDNLTLGFGSGAFTVEGWVYLNNISSTKGIVFGRGNNSFGLRVGQGYLGNVNGLNIVKAGVADLDYCSFTFATNTWYHIAVVRSGTTIYFFVNGTQQTTLGSGAGSFNYVNPTSGFYVGCNNDTNEQFAGYIDDLRITKGYARYTSNFTAPTSALITK